jgi:multiple sugar transport system substrate-binding protein
MWHGWTGSDNTTAMNAVISLFNSSNKDGLKVNPTGLDWDTLFSKWVVSSAAGNAPDVVIIHTSEVPEYSKRGILLPITDRIASTGIDLKGMPPAVVSACRYDGQMYAVPGDIHPLGMYFNVDMVQAAGLDPSKPPKTQAEFLTWAEKLTKGNVTAVDLPTSGAIPRWVWFSLLHQFGGTFLDDKGKAAVNSEAGMKALQFMVDLLQKNRFASKGGSGLAGTANQFAAKQTAIRFIGPWEVNQYMAAKLNFMTAPLPIIGSKPAAWGNSHVLGLSKQRSDAKYDAGMKFIKWFSDNYQKPAVTVGIIPVNPKALKSPEWTGSKQYRYYKAFVDTLPNVVFEPSITQYTRIFSFAKPTALSTNLEAALNGNKSVKQALDDMKKGIDEDLV